MADQVVLKEGAWKWDRERLIRFPDHWEVQVFAHKPVPALDESGIRMRLASPAGGDRLDALLEGKQRVLIICDDFSRPTRTDLLLPLLVDDLLAGGIKREHISILIATGTHHSMTREEIRLKLGERIARDHAVFLHDFRKKGVCLGKTEQGTPVYVNRQVVRHELVIGLGGIYPHSTSGFGGGAKLILGVCSIRTILHFHARREGAPTGGTVDNDFRRDVLDAARLAGMTYMVCSMVNQERELTEVVAGEVDRAFRQGVELARKVYGVPGPEKGDFDLVIADPYPFDASYAFARKGWWPVRHEAHRGHRLLLAMMPEGIGSHLIYPMPRDRFLNKFLRLYYEWQAFGWRHFLTRTLVSRLKGLSRFFPGRRARSRKPAGIAPEAGKIREGFPGAGVDILHHADGKARRSLEALPNRCFDDPEACFRHISAMTGNRPLKVALYRASALTFPEDP